VERKQNCAGSEGRPCTVAGKVQLGCACYKELVQGKLPSAGPTVLGSRFDLKLCWIVADSVYVPEYVISWKVPSSAGAC